MTERCVVSVEMCPDKNPNNLIIKKGKRVRCLDLLTLRSPESSEPEPEIVPHGTESSSSGSIGLLHMQPARANLPFYIPILLVLILGEIWSLF